MINPPLGEHIFSTKNLDGGTITPLIQIKHSFGSLDPPHNKPPNNNPPLGRTIICYYQSRLRLDFPPHKKRFLVNPPLILLNLAVLLLTAKHRFINNIYTKSFRNAIGIGARAFRSDYGRGHFIKGGVRRGGTQPTITPLIK